MNGDSPLSGESRMRWRTWSRLTVATFDPVRHIGPVPENRNRDEGEDGVFLDFDLFATYMYCYARFKHALWSC